MMVQIKLDNAQMHCATGSDTGSLGSDIKITIQISIKATKPDETCLMRTFLIVS